MHPERGLAEAPAVEAGTGVTVVPVLGWEERTTDTALRCRLLGILVLRSSGPEWIPIEGSRDDYGSAAAGSPVPPGELLALAASVDHGPDGVVFRPAAPATWPSITITSDGAVRRG